MAFMGSGVTGGRGAGATSSPFNYGPSLAGGAGAFGDAWAGYWNQRAQQTGNQADLANAQRVQQQTAAMRQRQAAQDAATRRQQAAAGQAPSWHNAAGAGYAGTPLGDVARRPQQPAAPAAPAAAPAAQPPLLAALQQPAPTQQQPAQQQQVSPELSAIAKAIGASAGQVGAPDQEQFLKRLRQMLTTGSL